MIDLDELDRINNAGDRYGHITPGVVAELIAEVRKLREDADRWQTHVRLLRNNHAESVVNELVDAVEFARGLS